jgi:hypothetical protein
MIDLGDDVPRGTGQEQVGPAAAEVHQVSLRIA